ncbi:PLP-dependent transferase [Dactylosporangium sp. NPDC005555]|uniref:PLP-dependent transferase n=1 Tax=Dactylosporangium sp. NPDC005555 TaxID=3154889 RepID=UPI0033BD058D
MSAPATVRRALAANPGVRAVFVGDPSYVGTVGDIAGLAAAAHGSGVPLVVDAAWAAHFGFHPALPRHPLQLGADVMVTSAHKTLPAWSQARRAGVRIAYAADPSLRTLRVTHT